MNFLTLLLKKNGKKKLNIILLLLVIFFITLMYRGNLTTAYMFENTDYRTQELTDIENMIDVSTEALEVYEKGSEIYDRILHQLNIAKQQKKYHEIRTQSFQQKNWKKYYEADAKLIDLEIEIQEMLESTDYELIDVRNIDKKYDQYMAQNQSYFETRFDSIHGVSFLINMINAYFPLIFAVLIIFLASNVYCSSYIDHINIHNVLPLGRLKKQGSKLFAGVVLGLGLFIFFAAFIFIYCTMIEGFGSIHSPVLTYTIKGENNFVSFMTLLPQLIILGTLAILFIINLVSIISSFTKRNIVCLIISLAVVLGGMWVSTNIAPFRNIAYLLPTTYISSLKVITGEMMFDIGITNVNYLNGVIVLCVSNAFLFATYYFLSDFSRKRKKVFTSSSYVVDDTYRNGKNLNGTFGYIKFISKRVFYRKSNIILVLLTIGISSIFLIMNLGNQSLLKKNMEQQIVTNNESIETNEVQLSKYQKDSEEYVIYKQQIEELQSENEEYKKLLINIENNDWTEVYNTYPKILEKYKEISAQSNTEDIAQNQQKQITFFKYLKEHDLKYENPEFPIYGLSFITSLAKIILPVIITACCIYLLAQFYTLEYVKGLDISILYPFDKRKTFITKIILGIVFSVAMYSVILLSIFLIATLFTGNAGLQQPLMMQNAKGVWYAVSMISMFKGWFIIGILFIVNVSIFMYILSYFIREDMFVLIVALLMILGLAYLPTFVGGLTQYSHLLPTTYMNSASVADGSLAQQFSNLNITVSSGMQILSVSIIIQVIGCVILNNSHKIRFKK